MKKTPLLFPLLMILAAALAACADSAEPLAVTPTALVQTAESAPPASLTPTATTTQEPTQTKAPSPTTTPTLTRTPRPTETLTATAAPTQTATEPPAPMALIPAGEFLMGSQSGDEDERPVHRVYLDAYAMDLYEVTNAQLARFLQARGNRVEGGEAWLGDRPGVRIHRVGGTWQADAGFEDHPAVSVSWYGARAYCQQRGADLPSEAQWEKAARGGLEGKVYPWGSQKPVCQPGAVNGAQFAECGGTIAVGSFAPNGYGLFDMAGNALEWLLDWYQADYYASQTDWRNPWGPPSGEARVLRGGSWDDYPLYLRLTYRSRLAPSSRFRYVGFRCASAP